MKVYYGITLAFLIYGALLKTLEHHGYTLLDVEKLFAKRWRIIRWGVIVKRVYLFFASTLSIYLILTPLALLTITHAFQQNIVSFVMIVILMVGALLGVWIPALQRLRNRRIKVAIDIIRPCLVVLLLIGFWIIKWPLWHVPAILTSLLVLVFVAYLIDALITKRKQKPAGRID